MELERITLELDELLERVQADRIPLLFHISERQELSRDEAKTGERVEASKISALEQRQPNSLQLAQFAFRSCAEDIFNHSSSCPIKERWL